MTASDAQPDRARGSGQDQHPLQDPHQAAHHGSFADTEVGLGQRLVEAVGDVVEVRTEARRTASATAG